VAVNGVVTASLVPERGVRRRHPEDDLQRQVMAFLDVALPAEAVAFAVPNGGKRHAREAARMKGLGVKAGVPDLCVVYRGRAAFLELKAKRGVMSPAQKAMQKRLIYAGADVCLCKSVAEVEASLLEAAIPLRARLS
jgi:hypothetical protein